MSKRNTYEMNNVVKWTLKLLIQVALVSGIRILKVKLRNVFFFLHLFCALCVICNCMYIKFKQRI